MYSQSKDEESQSIVHLEILLDSVSLSGLLGVDDQDTVVELLTLAQMEVVS